MEEKELKREVRCIKAIAKVLNDLADKAEKKEYLDMYDLEVFKKAGSTLVFKGCSLDFIMDIHKVKK